MISTCTKRGVYREICVRKDIRNRVQVDVVGISSCQSAQGRLDFTDSNKTSKRPGSSGKIFVAHVMHTLPETNFFIAP